MCFYKLRRKYHCGFVLYVHVNIYPNRPIDGVCGKTDIQATLPLQENIDRNGSAHLGKYRSCKTCGRRPASSY